jgi:hypothetical protein
LFEEGSKDDRAKTHSLKGVYTIFGLGFVLLLTLGVFAKNGWLPSTDPFTGKKTGWFGKPLARNASSNWNPLAPPLPTPTPGLSREYLYAGSRLLNTIDANAQEAPPADLAVWRPSTGGWWVMGGQWSQQVSAAWGIPTDEPAEGDYDGDGKTDFAVWRKTESSTGAGDLGNWYIVYSSSSTTAQYPFGQAGDLPAQADFNGDGTTDSAVFRSGTWHIRYSGSGTTTQQQFGLSTDKVAPADYDGDGRADIGVWRESNKTFYSLNSTDGYAQTINMSPQTGAPVSSDFDGDGKADYAVYDASNANWHIRQSATAAVITVQWGNAGDVPVQNDYDGDGKTDIATWRDGNGNWYILQSASGNSPRQVQWGVSGDIPVPALYRR